MKQLNSRYVDIRDDDKEIAILQRLACMGIDKDFILISISLYAYSLILLVDILDRRSARWDSLLAEEIRAILRKVNTKQRTTSFRVNGPTTNSP